MLDRVGVLMIVEQVPGTINSIEGSIIVRINAYSTRCFMHFATDFIFLFSLLQL